MAVTSAERLARHRAGQSSMLAKRVQGASLNTILDASEQKVFRSHLPTIAGTTTTADRAYWVYLGRAAKDLVVTNIKFNVSTVAVGTQAAEIAVASSDSAPNGAAQSLTVLGISAALDDLTTGTGPKGSIAAISVAVPQTTHLWAGLRVNMTSTPTQPVVYGLTNDDAHGQILITSTAGVLAVGSTYTGALITASLAWQAPALTAITY